MQSKSRVRYLVILLKQLRNFWKSSCKALKAGLTAAGAVVTFLLDRRSKMKQNSHISAVIPLHRNFILK